MSGFEQEDRRKVVIGTLVTVAGGLAFALYQGSDFVLERVFGLAAFGTYVVVLSLVEFLGHLLLAGFLDAVTVFASRAIHGSGQPIEARPVNPQLDRVLATCVLLPFLAALVLALGIWLGVDAIYEAVWPRHDPAIKELLSVSVWALPMMVLMHVPVEALKAHLNVSASVFVTQVLFPYGILGIAMALHLGAGMGIEAMAYGLVISASVCVPISVYLCSRAIRITPVVRALFTQGPDKEVLAFAVPQSLNMGFNLGMVRIDALVLSVIPSVTPQAIGLYGLAVRATQLIRLLKMAFSGMFGPLAAKYHAGNNRQGLKEALHSFSRLSWTLTLPAWLIVMALFPAYAATHAPELTKQGLEFVWILTIGPVLGGMIGFAGNLLLMTGHAKVLLLNSSVASALNVALNFWLIPQWGLVGAALATAISGTLMALAQMVEMQRFEGYYFEWSLYRNAIVAAVLPTVLVLCLHQPSLGLWEAWPFERFALELTVCAVALLLYLVAMALLPGESVIIEPLRARVAAWKNDRKSAS